MMEGLSTLMLSEAGTCWALSHWKRPWEGQHHHQDLLWGLMKGKTETKVNTNMKCLLNPFLKAANSWWENVSLTPMLAHSRGFRERAAQLQVRKRGSGSWLAQNAVRDCFLMEFLLVAVFWAKPFNHAKHVAKWGVQKYWSACFEVKLKV